MIRIHTALSAALLAASMVSGAAIAADQPSKTNKADKTQVVPPRDDLKPGAAPSVQRMDDNAQRAHDRNTGSSKAGTAAPAASRVDPAQVRDWSKIDKNSDHLIGPEEMEDWLKQEGSKKS